MPAYPAVLTEKDAVNTMLRTIKMAPINSLSGQLTADVSTAINLLAEVSRRVQISGWHFNTEYKYPLNVNGDGEISIADNIADVDLDKYSYPRASYDVIKRGSRMYDLKNRTYQFSENLAATVIVMLPFSDLPDSAKNFITIMAAREFQQSILGSETQDGFTFQQERKAETIFHRMEAQRQDTTIFDSPSMQEFLNR